MMAVEFFNSMILIMLGILAAILLACISVPFVVFLVWWGSKCVNFLENKLERRTKHE